MLKGIRIRLYPNKKQEIYINKLIGSYRFVYNQCLDLKVKEYTINKKSIGLKELGNYFHQYLIKQPEYEFLKEHNTKVLKQSVITLLDSYKRFFINGNGFPKFKSKHSNDRFFPSSKTCSCCGYLNKDLTLNDRTWKCIQCNSMLDRDLNAAINIRNEGIKLYKIGHRLPELKPLESSSIEHSVN